MSAQKTSDSTKPLSHYVAHSLDGFFKALNGHAPKDLYGMILDQVEAPLLRATLKYCDGNQSRAAEVLGLNRATLRKKLRHHKIKEQPSARAGNGPCCPLPTRPVSLISPAPSPASASSCCPPAARTAC